MTAMQKQITKEILDRLNSYADDFYRIKLNGKTIYSGIGNTAGIHSYLATLERETFAKWERASKKVAVGTEFESIEILRYASITRDRGRWVSVRTY